MINNAFPVIMSEPKPRFANQYFRAIQATDQKEADKILESLIYQAMGENESLSYEAARKIQLENIGYHFGYLDPEELEVALKLYPEAEHPVLGRTFNDLDASTMIKAGIAYAEKGLEAAREIVAEARKAKA